MSFSFTPEECLKGRDNSLGKRGLGSLRDSITGVEGFSDVVLKREREGMYYAFYTCAPGGVIEHSMYSSYHIYQGLVRQDAGWDAA